MSYTPQYDYSSLGVLIGTVGYGQISSGSMDLHSVTFNPLPGRASADVFTAGDVGKIITVMGAGVGGKLLKAHIAAYIAADHVILDTAASTTAIAGTANVTVFRPAKVTMGIEYTGNLMDVSEGSFSVLVDGGYPPEAGQPFLFTSTDPAVCDSFGTFWGGEIDSVENVYQGFQDGANKVIEAQCKCVSYKAVLQRRVMLGKQYSSTDLATIGADICSQATADFIDFSYAANPSVSLLTIDDYTYLADALDALKDIVSGGATKYFWRIDHWREVHFITETSDPAPWSVSDTGGSDGNVQVNVSRTRARDKMANQTYAKASKALGDMQTMNVSNTFNGSALPYARRTITLTMKAGITPKISVSGINKRVWVSPVDVRNDTGATVTIPAGYDWAWPESSDYLFCNGSLPGIPSGESAVVTFYPASDAISHSLNTTSQAERAGVQGGSGLHESVENVDVPLSRVELDSWVAGHVAAFGEMPESVNLEGYRGGLFPGMGLTVHLTEIGATVNYLVESVKLSEDNGWVHWSIKASIGALLGDWTAALLRALGGEQGLGGGAGYLVTGSVLDAQFVGGSGIVTVPYAAKVLVNGGVAPYYWQLKSGDSLPGGLMLDSGTGIISGTPTTVGSYDFHIAVLDNADNSVEALCHIDVAPAPSDGSAELTGTVTVLTATEGTDWVAPDGTNRRVISVYVECNAYPKRFTLETEDTQYGRVNHGWFRATGPTTISLGAKDSGTDVFAPTRADETWTVRAAVGTWDKNTLLSGVTGVASTTVLIHAPGVYGTSGDSSFTAPAVNYYKTIAGAYIYTITFQANLPLSDKKFWFMALYNQTGTGTGGGFTPAGANAGNTRMGDWASPTAYITTEDHAPWMVLDTDVAAGNVNITLGPWNVPADGINTLRLTAILGTRKDDGSGGTKTQQYTWPSGAHYYDVVLDPDKAQTDATLIDPTTLGSGMTKHPTTKKLMVNYGSGVQDDGTGKVSIKYGSALKDDGTGAVTIDVLPAGPLYKNVSNQLALRMTGDLAVDGSGNLSVAAVNMANAYGYGTEFTKVGGVFVVNGIAVNKLLAGSAIFLGTAVFQYSTNGGSVAIGSTGLTLADNAGSPANTVVLSSSGVTVAHGSNRVEVTASGVGIYGPVGTLTATSSGIVITDGSSHSLTLTAGAITLLGGTISGGALSIATATGTVSINSGTNGVSIAASAYNSAAVSISGGGYSGNLTPTSLSLSNGSIFLSTSSGYLGAITYGSSSASVSGSLVVYGGVTLSGSYTLSAYQGSFSYLQVGGVNVINGSGQFTGNGVYCPFYGVTCNSLYVGSGGINYNGSSGASQNLGFYDSLGGFCKISINGGFASATQMTFRLGGYTGQV